MTILILIRKLGMAVYVTHRHRFNGHSPRKLGLASCQTPLRYLYSSLSWASSRDRLKLCTCRILRAVPHPLALTISQWVLKQNPSKSIKTLKEKQSILVV